MCLYKFRDIPTKHFYKVNVLLLLCDRMVRNYKRKGSWEESETYRSVIPRALEAMTTQGMTIRQAAEQYGINRETLRRHIKKFCADKHYTYKPYTEKLATRRVFSSEEEADLAEYFISAARSRFPAPTDAARKMAYDFALRKGKQLPDVWNKTEMASRDWLSAFSKRNAVTLRVPEGLSLARAEGFNPHTVQHLFSNLTRAYERYGFTPEKVYNLDETGLSTTTKCRRVLAKKGA